VRVYSAADYAVLPTLPEFSPPQSSESAGRREFYRSQGRRKAALSSFGGDYEEFLRSCHIRLSVRPASIDQLDRIDELTQRTNQLNFSGTRYSKEAIAGLLAGDGHDCFAMSAVDDFGDYGTVGFAVVETDAPRLTDLMLSCRIQGKRVEHAFLEFLLSWYGRQGRDELAARYVETERNAAAGRVFADLGFELVTADGAVKTYRLAVADATLGARPVSVYWEDRPWSW
jgi:FkbH-like protein